VRNPQQGAGRPAHSHRRPTGLNAD
jgi:hypothetical protein